MANRQDHLLSWECFTPPRSLEKRTILAFQRCVNLDAGQWAGLASGKDKSLRKLQPQGMTHLELPSEEFEIRSPRAWGYFYFVSLSDLLCSPFHFQFHLTDFLRWEISISVSPSPALLLPRYPSLFPIWWPPLPCVLVGHCLNEVFPLQVFFFVSCKRTIYLNTSFILFWLYFYAVLITALLLFIFNF